MKNVRLFAVAAAMGMFASTVSAASTTKYDVKWDSAQGNAIKVDLNDTIVAPVVNATATATVVSNEGTATEVCTTVDGFKGVDHNLDGREDTLFYQTTIDPVGTRGLAYADASFLYFTDLKYTGTAKTMHYYVGLGTDGSFGRIIAPGTPAVDGFIDGAKHKLYSTAEEIEALYGIFTANESVEVITDEDGRESYIIDLSDDADSSMYVSNDYSVLSLYANTAFPLKATAGAGAGAINVATGNELRVVMNGAAANTDVIAYHVAPNGVVTPIDATDASWAAVFTNSLVGTAKSAYGAVSKEYMVPHYVNAAGLPDARTTTYKATTSFTLITDQYSKNTSVANENAKAAFMDYATGLITEDTADDQYVWNAAYQMFNATSGDLASGAPFNNTAGVTYASATDLGNSYGVFIDGVTATSYDLGAQPANNFNLKYYTIGRRGTLDEHNVQITTKSDLLAGISPVSSLYAKLTTTPIVLILDETISDGDRIVDHFEDVLVLNTEFGNVRAFDYVWNEDAEEFVKAERVWNLLAPLNENSLIVKEANELIDNFGGFYRTKTQANTTDKYIIDMTMGAYPTSYYDFVNLGYAEISKTKEKITFEALPSYEVMYASPKSPLALGYINIGTKRDDYWVVATDTMDEAQRLLVSLSGITRATDNFVDVLEPYANAIESLNKSSKEITYADYAKVAETKWGYSAWNSAYDPTGLGAGTAWLGAYGSFKVVAGDRSYADGTKTAYVPQNIFDHYSAQLCVYQGETTTPEVVVTNNVSEIDTTTAGVKTLTYTATVDGKAVDTFDMTVVVAPKYVRTWEGGKVKTLTSFYLDGTTKYAFYDYNWSAKTVTITYYNTDGSVSTTVTNAL